MSGTDIVVVTKRVVAIFYAPKRAYKLPQAEAITGTHGVVAPTQTRKGVLIMNREFLEGLGLENAGGDDGDSKLKERIKTLETEKSDLKTKLQQKDQEKDALKVKHAAERQVIEAKALDVTSVLAHVDLSEAELDENGNVQGLAEKLESLSEEKTFLFEVQEAQEPNKPKPWSQRGNGTVNKGGLTKEQIMKTEDKRERQRLIQENKDLF